MYRSSDLTDEPSRLKQFAWEQWDTQMFAVLFRPGAYGLDRYIVKRYVEQVLSQSEHWRQLYPYFPSVTQVVRSFAMTAHETELMQRILDHHLNNTLHLTIKLNHDQLIEFDDLMDFIRRAQELLSTTYNTSNSTRLGTSKKTTIITIPSINSSYVLPPSVKSLLPTPKEMTAAKATPVKSIMNKAPCINPSLASSIVVQPQISKVVNPSPSTTNGHTSSTNVPVRTSPNRNIKPNISSVAVTKTKTPPPTICQSVGSNLPEFNPTTITSAKIDGRGWVQINNVFLPFVIKNRHRLIPYQVLVSCKILDGTELRGILTRASAADRMVMNQMIRECKIHNEEITENSLLISVYHVLVGTKNLVYVKLLPIDNPTSKINRQYRSVLALRGGCLCITNRMVPYVCSSNHSYIPLADVLSIYPNLQSQLKPLARVPRTHELDFLQLVQIYYDEKELPSDTLLIDVEDLSQCRIIPSKNVTLIEYHDREKDQLEQQIAQLNTQQPGNNKRKSSDSIDNQSAQPKFRATSIPSAGVVRPPTGYLPNSASSSSSSSYPAQFQQNHWLSSNYEPNGRTH